MGTPGLPNNSRSPRNERAYGTCITRSIFGASESMKSSSRCSHHSIRCAETDRHPVGIPTGDHFNRTGVPLPSRVPPRRHGVDVQGYLWSAHYAFGKHRQGDAMPTRGVRGRPLLKTPVGASGRGMCGQPLYASGCWSPLDTEARSRCCRSRPQVADLTAERERRLGLQPGSAQSSEQSYAFCQWLSRWRPSGGGKVVGRRLRLTDFMRRG